MMKQDTLARFIGLGMIAFAILVCLVFETTDNRLDDLEKLGIYDRCFLAQTVEEKQDIILNMIWEHRTWIENGDIEHIELDKKLEDLAAKWDRDMDGETDK